YGYFVLPESLPPSRRRPVNWRTALNPLASLASLGRLGGIGLLIAVIACTALAQFILYTSWVLHNQFKFGWGPAANGWSLFAVGVMSALVQGLLLGKLLKRFAPQRLAVAGLISSTLAYLGWALASEGWMIYAVILCNVLGFTVSATLQSVVSGAAAADKQGTTMGAVSGLQSLMAVIAPLLSAPLLAFAAGLPRGDRRLRAPFYACAALQATALVLAWRHFARMPAPMSPAAAAAD
ncbi:MAG: MFS transporter, partial [Pseudomonadota bacterium]|nr:MFS transporter [Pseudomonadota bacterium]